MITSKLAWVPFPRPATRSVRIVTTHVNCTPFSTLVFETLDHRDREYHVAVIRATCDLTDGGELRPAAAQTPAARAYR